MNVCILQAEIIQEPQLRYTQDSQLAVTDMLVQFPGLRPEDPHGRLKVVAWGNLAEQTAKQFKVGDHIVIEGRLGMIRADLPGGGRMTRAELTAARIFPVQVGEALTAETAPASAPPTVTATLEDSDGEFAIPF
ncbi:MAG: single-stranded DNA-binding protein [Gloeomargarita sp. SKYG116]|nr:single-stranded DNA-binding protein [Gloeomargarita sp. SKYG116]MDW8400145.1 single-stranded DNA-binding protein [Gloeomargarita sp. SKYGB_i_bin116]